MKGKFLEFTENLQKKRKFSEIVGFFSFYR
nr:MAG TPA: hypothetical protein [Caudoviricetes sp.]